MLSVNFLVSAISSHYLKAMKIDKLSFFFLTEFPASSLVRLVSPLFSHVLFKPTSSAYGALVLLPLSDFVLSIKRSLSLCHLDPDLVLD